MAIVNRDLDPSQQRQTYQALLDRTPSSISAGIANPGLSTGNTFLVCNIPFPSQLMAASEACYGTSGSPVHSLWIYRFAAGFTSIAIGQTMAITAFGTSGIQGFSLFAATTFQLLAGDQLVLYTQASNAAVANAMVTVVVKALQDIKTDFGV